MNTDKKILSKILANIIHKHDKKKKRHLLTSRFFGIQGSSTYEN